MADEIEKEFGWIPGFITPYVVLYKLENEGYVKKTEKGRRIYYTITKEGKQALQTAKKMLHKTADSF